MSFYYYHLRFFDEEMEIAKISDSCKVSHGNENMFPEQLLYAKHAISSFVMITAMSASICCLSCLKGDLRVLILTNM